MKAKCFLLGRCTRYLLLFGSVSAKGVAIRTSGLPLMVMETSTTARHLLTLTTLEIMVGYVGAAQKTVVKDVSTLGPGRDVLWMPGGRAVWRRCRAPLVVTGVGNWLQFNIKMRVGQRGSYIKNSPPVCPRIPLSARGNGS